MTVEGSIKPKAGFRLTNAETHLSFAVSERLIAQFCGACARLGSNNICNGLSDPFNHQANNAWYGLCEQANVGGQRGLIKDEFGYRKLPRSSYKRTPVFIPQDWMGKTIAEIYANLDDTARQLVRSVSPERVQIEKRGIEEELRKAHERYQAKWEAGEKDAVDLNEYPWYPYAAVFSEFFCKLPFSDDYFNNKGINPRAYRGLYDWDIKLRDYLEAKGEGDAIKNHSELRLDQTRKMFFATIDAAIEAEGLSYEEIARLNHRPGDDPYRYVQLHIYVKTVFARLKALGFTWRELTR